LPWGCHESRKEVKTRHGSHTWTPLVAAVELPASDPELLDWIEAVMDAVPVDGPLPGPTPDPPIALNFASEFYKGGWASVEIHSLRTDSVN
jgi:hypothetical protein